MTFTPVIHPLLIALIACAGLGITITAALRQRGARGSGGAQSRHRLRWGMRTLLVLACVALLLRPGIPGGKVQVFAENADIFIVVDTSASIIAEDWGGGEPRLDGVREDVQAIVDRYPGARFSLVTFDTGTSVRLPLTTDSTALIAGLSVLTPEVTGRSGGTSITQASSVLAELLRAAQVSGADRSRLVFYFGDGEQTASEPPGSFASSKQYVGAGYVFGYGTAEGGPMKVTHADPSKSGTEYIEFQGERARSVIDEENLRMIADQLEVGYQHRAAGEAIVLPDVPQVATRHAMGEVGASTELYWIAAAVAGVIFAVEIAMMTAAIARVNRVTREGGAR